MVNQENTVAADSMAVIMDIELCNVIIVYDYLCNYYIIYVLRCGRYFISFI